MHTRGNSLFSTKTQLGLLEWLKYLTSPRFIEILSLFKFLYFLNLLSKSLTKTKLIDPLILILLQNIKVQRSKLNDLNCIEVDPKLSNIISNVEGKELFIENEFYKAKGFRKLHIEVAEFSKSLKILH